MGVIKLSPSRSSPKLIVMIKNHDNDDDIKNGDGNDDDHDDGDEEEDSMLCRPLLVGKYSSFRRDNCHYHSENNEFSYNLIKH